LETAQTSDDAEARAAASAAAAVAAAAAFDARGETENQRRWREMHEAREKEEKEEKEKEAEEERAAAASASSVSDAAAMIGETLKVGDEKASPSADGDAKKVVPSAAKIGAAAPAAAAAYLRPSLRGAAELGDELD
jgi:dynein assembly factor 2